MNVPGFKTHVRQNLGVQAAQTIRIDVVLEVGTSAESVTVSAQASMLSTESAAVNSNVTTRSHEFAADPGRGRGYRQYIRGA